MIKPTIGRVVWYHPTKNETLAAIVCFVHSDTLINIAAFDSAGRHGGISKVPLYQNDPNEEQPEVPYCEWMPYQQGQAAKTEALEKQLSSKEQK